MTKGCVVGVSVCTLCCVPLVDVGSGLANDDWDEIDDKGVRCWCVSVLSVVFLWWM